MYTDQPKRLKVLLGCYACDPNFGSEPGMGWNFVKNIAKFHDVHAIVEKYEFEENLTKYSLEHPEEVKNITFHFIPRVHHNTLRKIWPPSYYWFYRKWQKQAYLYALELDKKENFDIVHQLTLAGYREPGYLWKLEKPFIWGPIGGLNQTAFCLLRYMGWYGKVFYIMRNIINTFHKKWSYAAKIVVPKAHSIIVSDPDSTQDIKKLWHRDPILMREVGVEKIEHKHHEYNHLPDKPLIICWSGVHEPRKGLPILIEAISHCKRPMLVHVLGKGPCTKKWENLTKIYHVQNQFIFHGTIPHTKVFSIMRECHVFALTSISEGGTTTIVLEALQLGLPIIALNNCAYASVITEKCGIKIDLKHGKTIPQQFAQKLDELFDDEEKRSRLSHGAIIRSQDFLWDDKIQKLNKIYEQAIKK